MNAEMQHPPLRDLAQIPKFPRGEIWYKFCEPCKEDETDWEYLGENIITTDASIIVARLIADPTEPTSGAFALAVGTGDTGWDLQNVPVALSTQGSLFAEIDRKEFSAIDFINAGTGLTSTIPTNILDFTVTFATSEAVGPLVEMGIVCAAIDIVPPLTATPLPQVSWNDPAVDRRLWDMFLNVRNFNVINKPGTMTLTFVWRVTF